MNGVHVQDQIDEIKEWQLKIEKRLEALEPDVWKAEIEIRVDALEKRKSFCRGHGRAE